MLRPCPGKAFALDPDQLSQAALEFVTVKAQGVLADGNRIELRITEEFPPGRTRVNCTLPAGEGRWRWFGMQFFVPEP